MCQNMQKRKQMPSTWSPPSVFDHPFLRTSSSNRNLIFQAIIVFPFPYFYRGYRCRLEAHRLPPYAPFVPPPAPRPSLFSFLYLFLSNSLPSLCLCLRSFLTSLLLFLFFFPLSHSSRSLPPPLHTACLLSVYLLFCSSAVRATDSDGSQMLDERQTERHMHAITCSHSHACWQLHTHEESLAGTHLLVDVRNFTATLSPRRIYSTIWLNY